MTMQKENDAQQTTTDDPWRETVRDIFDTLHHGEDDIFTGSRLAKRLVAMIEVRHHDFFCEGAEGEGERVDQSPNEALMRLSRSQENDL